jgi:hypothetical protein
MLMPPSINDTSADGAEPAASPCRQTIPALVLDLPSLLGRPSHTP